MRLLNVSFQILKKKKILVKKVINLLIIIFIIVIFPQDILENGVLAASNFAMLGLGDIVIPGIFIAFLLRFDQRYVMKNIYLDTN